ncbi:MAG: integrase [Thermoplasmataceae archaeon]
MQRETKITSVRINVDLLDKANQQGLNLSKWMNVKLDEFLNGKLTTISDKNESKITRALVVRMSNDFRNWLIANRNDKKYIKSLEMYLTKYFDGLMLSSPQNIIEYTSKMKTTSKYPILALRLYIKFLEETRQLTAEDATHLKKVLKVKKSKPDTYVPTDEKILEAYMKLTDEKDKLLFQILTFSGIRITEMSKMLSEFDEKNLTKNVSYARYSLNFNRGQKRSFYVYMPIEIAKKVRRFYKVDAKAITKLFGIKTGLTPKYLRKWFYNKVIMAGVPESVADFYEGRSPATVGSSNYLAKTQQGDHWYETAIETLKKTIPL